jgi:hypothetical protein
MLFHALAAGRQPDNDPEPEILLDDPTVVPVPAFDPSRMG